MRFFFAQQNRDGFTLIEISIVLVIIGLIVGGILTGQDLINVAAIRAQISQIEKYQTAVRTFQGKYGYLPGDIPNPYASQFGFQSRGTNTAEGDGNGIIESNCGDVAGTHNGSWEGCGELAVFWEDLSTARLIDTTIFGVDTAGNGYPAISAHFQNVTPTSTPNITQWLPAAKIGNSNYVYLYSQSATNYFTVSTVTQIGWNIQSSSNPGLTAQQAYNIDNKVDDGLPQSGNVTACYQNYLVNNSPSTIWAANGAQGANNGTAINNYGGSTNCTATTALTAWASTNCFDNNGTANTAQTYSIAKNAAVPNCALSFKFQ